MGAYHKHSWYLIRHGELLGYSDDDHLIVAAIARYHRRSLPKKRHEAWQLLESRDARRLVGSMALLLRLAAALDRRPEARVASLRVSVDSNRLAIELVPTAPGLDLSLEQWSLQGCARPLLEATGRVLQVS